jgi:hypothetical protein
MLITDRDLLALDPSVFLSTGAGGVATSLYASADAAVSGSTLTSAAGDFADRNITAGHVAVVDGQAVEVVGRTSATVLEVSQPRVSKEEAAIAPGDGSNLAMNVLTFARLIGQEQSRLLREIGADIEDPERPLDEMAVVNAAAVGGLIAQRVLHAAYAQAAAREPSSLSLAARALMWLGSLTRAEASLVAMIDLDNDGWPEFRRHLRAPRWVRA